MDIEKINNESVKAEEQVIGSLLINPESISEIIDDLAPEMFYNKILSKAYKICIKSAEEGDPFDITSICLDLGHETEADEQTIQECMIGCFNAVTTSTAIKKHSDTVKRCYANRLIYSKMQTILTNPAGAIEDILGLGDEVEGLVAKKESYENLSAIAKKYQDQYFCDKPTTGITIGIKSIDECIGELEGGDVIVIGARPAVGKSAFALQMVRHVAKQGKKIGYFNLEMTKKQVFERFVAIESGIGLTRIRRAIRFMNDEKEKYDQAIKTFEDDKNIYIPTGSKTIADLRMIHSREKFDIIVVDYLQLIKPGNRYKGNRFAEVGKISHDLKALATDFDIPIVLLSQLNRVSEGKADKEPSMSELRESGDIEQDASIIMFLWNKDEEDRTKKGWKIDKNRQGTLKKGDLIFDGDRMKFIDEMDEEFHDIDSFNFDIPFDITGG